MVKHDKEHLAGRDNEHHWPSQNISGPSGCQLLRTKYDTIVYRIRI